MSNTIWSPSSITRQAALHDLAVHQADKLAEIVADLDLDNPYPIVQTGATAGGDERRLRGIPAIGRGVAGAIPGTRPGANLR
jgi:hypothetical protein